MPQRPKFPRFGFGSMLIGMVSVLVVSTLADDDLLFNRVLIRLSISVLLIASVYLLSHNRRVLVTAVVLGLPTLATNWGVVTHEYPWLMLMNYCSNVLFFSYVTWCLLQQIFTARRVTGDTIWGSICIYLMLGFVWSFIYGALAVVQAGAFKDVAAEQVASLVYFSFVTLSTLGYGDITPLTRQAQVLAFSEALVGQLYLTVLVARLVGLYSSNKGN